MKFLILSLFVLCISVSAFGVEKEQRYDAALAAIGAYVRANNDQKFARSYMELQTSEMRTSPKVLLQSYYVGNYESFYLKNAGSKEAKDNLSFGKIVMEKILQKLSKPLCEKLKICKLSCYVDVVGDVIDLILAAQPELLPVKSAFQTYIIDGGMKYLNQLCKC